MTWLAESLWDLIEKPFFRRPESVPAPGHEAGPVSGLGKRPMQDRYDDLVVEMKRQHGLRIRKWRSSSSGCAWKVTYEDGRVVSLIEAPYPRGPMSCVIFLHEVGHHAIGFKTYRLRCLEEYHAWRWALDAMETHGFNVTDAVNRRVTESMRYAVRKARRRGLQQVPPELSEYV